MRSHQILVEGPGAVTELLAHRPEAVVDVYIFEPAREAHSDLVALARETTVWVHPVTGEVSKTISTDSQGIAAVARTEAIEDPGLSTLTDIAGGDAPLVVLPRIQDPGNVGTLIRVADAFGARAVVVTAGSADVTNPKVIRASAGSCFHLPIVKANNLAEVGEALQNSGWQLVGTSGALGSIDLDDLLVEGLSGRGLLTCPHAWVYGNEARGLSESELAGCDHVVRLSMSGQAESLNVAAAAACTLYASQLVRIRGQ